jgi:lambda family phage portal protein
MSNTIRILDHSGRPMQRGMVTTGGALSAYEAASLTSAAVGAWQPRLDSADAANSYERDTISARVHDLVRNDGWASAGLQKKVDMAIGGGWRLSCKPDFRALGQTPEWAAEMSDKVEALWRAHTTDPRRFVDLERELDFAGLLALKFRHFCADGECLSVLRWKERGGMFATCEEIIDPDRLSNPNWRPDVETLRGGKERDADGVVVAYHIRSAHPGDTYFGARRAVWDRVPRETDWGRPIVIHHSEPARAGESRPVSPLAPILAKFRMLGRYDQAELQAAILNAVFAAFLESPFSGEELVQGMDNIVEYQELREAVHQRTGLRVDGVRLNTLAPGEKFNMTQAARPAVAFAAFEAACLRNIASAMGISYEQLSMDWSQTNYSSARGALMEVWRHITARKAHFAQGAVMPHYMAWMEEAFDLGYLEAPPGAPEFWAAPVAYLGCDWIGPARGWVDPVKEAQGSQLRQEAGVSTLEKEAAEQGGDYKEIMIQRRREMDEAAALGLTLQTWGGPVPLAAEVNDVPAAAPQAPANQTNN